MPSSDSCDLHALNSAQFDSALPPQTRRRTAAAAKTGGTSRDRSLGRGARGTRTTGGSLAVASSDRHDLDGPQRTPKNLDIRDNEIDELRRKIASLTVKFQTVIPSRDETKPFLPQCQHVVGKLVRPTTSATPEELTDLSLVSKASTGIDFADLTKKFSLNNSTEKPKKSCIRFLSKFAASYQPLPVKHCRNVRAKTSLSI